MVVRLLITSCIEGPIGLLAASECLESVEVHMKYKWCRKNCHQICLPFTTIFSRPFQKYTLPKPKTLSERPLYLEELPEAATLDLQHSLDPDQRFTNPYDIFDICSGLVTIYDQADDLDMRKKISFAHHTVKEYLMSNIARSSTQAVAFSFSEIDAQQLINHVNLSYLVSATQKNPDLGSEPTTFPLLNYVTEHWYSHITAASRTKKMPDWLATLAVVLFNTKRNENVLLGHNITNANAPEGPKTMRQNNPSFPSPLYYASILGLDEVVRMLIDKGDYIDEKGGFCGTALQAASYNGHGEVIQYLLDQGADINYVSGHYGTALQSAAHRGHLAILKSLLNSGADINATSGYYGDAM